MDKIETQLKNKTVSGIVWKFLERVLAQLVSLIVSIILARLLTPDDYSVVGIVAIFFAFANVFISGGFNAALIQKKDAEKEDYSSVLFISLFISVVLYLCLFFCAPYIAKIYEKPILIPVFRIMGIALIINAFKSIVCAYVSNHLLFRKFFWSTLGGTVLSAIVGIVMAIKGFGPWALVAQQLTNSVVDTFILYLTARVRFVLKFSKKRATGLFRYGWKILVASGISVLYDEINPLIIGIKYSGADLSYYTKGKSFPSLINGTIGDTLSSVLFPAMSKLQDNQSAILSYIRRFMKTASYIIFPLMIGFLAISDNFIIVLLTEKWLPAAIYIKAFCIVYMFNIIQTGNLQVIRAVGRSDLILKLEIIKKSLYALVILMFVLLTHKPEYLAYASIVNTAIATIVNTRPNNKLIGYKYVYQIADLLPNLLISVAMGVIVIIIGYLSINVYLLLLLQIVSGVLAYVLLSIITRNPNLVYLKDSIRSALGRIRHRGV